MVFEDLVVPDPLVAGPLVVATVSVALLLYAVRAPVSEELVLSFVPWMVMGSALHALYQMDRALGEALLPDPLPVLFSAPSVYLVTFVLMGAVLVVAVMTVPSRNRTAVIARALASFGAIAAVPVVGYAAWVGFDRFTPDPVVPLFGLLASLGLAVVLYLALGMWRAYVVADARYAGGLVLFAHVFDAITTAVGIEVFGAGERSTVPRLLLDIAADLPTAPLLGEAWLFVVVKVLVALLIVVGFHDYVDERPTEGYLFFALVAAVGLGPGTYNFLLFALGVGA